MKVTVKSIWGNGFVSIASKYVEKALTSGEDIELTVKGAKGLIPNAKLKTKKPRTGVFNDKFGRGVNYTLYDFFWNDIKL